MRYLAYIFWFLIVFPLAGFLGSSVTAGFRGSTQISWLDFFVIGGVATLVLLYLRYRRHKQMRRLKNLRKIRARKRRLAAHAENKRRPSS